eukprot:TRINITY_DN746_c0_g1_i12.p2 TRINITY_DN746_c0_g1~~TRINITY_DN746_c0_g1_i12.p2  ORF type:complete len:140 (-),score=42.39 TRINITY_DN746_c0_g1_i12:327-746(-)
MWGDGEQTRSFCYVDDAVEGVIRLMNSDFKDPLNVGSEEMVSMNDMAKIVMGFENKELSIKHIPGPRVCAAATPTTICAARCSAGAPEVSLSDGLNKTYMWIKSQLEAEAKDGKSAADYTTSKVVGTHAPSDSKASSRK